MRYIVKVIVLVNFCLWGFLSLVALTKCAIEPPSQTTKCPLFKDLIAAFARGFQFNVFVKPLTGFIENFDPIVYTFLILSGYIFIFATSVTILYYTLKIPKNAIMAFLKILILLISGFFLFIILAELLGEGQRAKQLYSEASKVVLDSVPSVIQFASGVYNKGNEIYEDFKKSSESK